MANIRHAGLLETTRSLVTISRFIFVRNRPLRLSTAEIALRQLRRRTLKDIVGIAEDLNRAKWILLRDGPVQLFRAQFQNSTAIVAIPRRPASEASLEQLRYEYSIREKFEGDFALHPLGMTVHDQTPALLLHDPGGRMLIELIHAAMPRETFIRQALAVTLSLVSAHEAGLVHGGLTPSHVMLLPGELRARLTGFRPRSAIPAISDFTNGMEREIDPEFLHYMAPEATGRVNRILDERSDLYSLGCIFFRMLTGRVLYPGLTAAEQIHAHIARRPDNALLSELKQRAGERVVELVCRLLAKEPAERFQRAFDVVDEIVNLRTINHVRPDSSGRKRRSSLTLSAPDRLVGRRTELERLRNALHGTSDNSAQRLWLIEGPPGIGKTALINQFRLQTDGEVCEFAQGKCELGDGVTPYASLARAFHSLSSAALGYPPHRYGLLEQRLHEMLSDDLSIVTTIFPDFSRLLGEHEHKPAVSAHAERPRFLETIAKLLGAFASRERPLLLFLDDLHWVDEGTLEVVTYLMQSPLCRHVLFVAAMRDRQVDNRGAHVRPFVLTGMVERIALEPLSGRDVGGLLRALLDDEVKDLNVLESDIYRGTGGNPLHTIQFVRALIDDHVMVYDEVNREWAASLSDVKARSDVSSVVDLLSTSVATLPDDCLAAAQYLAILAEPSSLEVLSIAMSRPQSEIQISLGEALEEQLIRLSDGLYSFTHDRVQDSVHRTLSDVEWIEIHLSVGIRLWEKVVQDGLKISLFTIANHINKGALQICSDRRREFASINLGAALKAKEATAYESAISYLVHAQKLLTERPDVNADLLSLIELRLGECEFLCMRVNAASERLAQISTGHLDSRHRAELIRLRLAMYVTLDQPDKALEVGFWYLKEEAGIETPIDIGLESVDEEYRRFLGLYGDRGIRELVDLKLMADERVRNAMDVMTDLIPPALFTSQELVEWLILRMINLSLEYGHCDASCYAYVCLSLIAGVRYGDFATSALFGELSMRLPEERGLDMYAGRVQMCFGALSLPWTGPVSLARQHLEDATKLTGSQGDLTFEVYSRRHVVTNLLFSGASLLETQQVAEDGLKLARSAGFALVIDAFMAQAWFIRELRGVPVDIGVSNPNVDYIDLLSDCISGKFHRDIAAFAFWTYRLQAAFLWGDLVGARDAEVHASETAWASPAFLENVDFVFYSGLLQIALARRTPPEERATHLIHVDQRIQSMRRWAQACPENFMSRHKLLEAEYAALIKEDASCILLYEEAITLADKCQDMHIQSVAREIASNFAGRCGLRSAQHGYLVQARSVYASWGADAKVRQLESEYPALKEKKFVEFQGLKNSTIWSEDRFDTEVVLSSVRALSGEISLQRVLQTILQNAVQYAGAERAVLCLLEDGGLHVVAQARMAHGDLQIDIVRQPLSPELIATPLAYLTLRTKESVVLEDAGNDPQYRFDSYVKRDKSRSIMCVPLLKQGALTGLLYLENGLIAGVFNATRVRTLEVLASQAAVSLENAKLYESVEAEHKRHAEAERRVRETQAKLDQTAKLTELGELAAFIVHEVSQPITAVGVSARAAIRWLSREIPNLDEAIVALEHVCASSERARNIVESIRGMIRKVPPKMSSMDIREAIEEVLSVLQKRIDADNVTVITKFTTESLFVLGDRTLLQQVIVNLVTNALEAMDNVTDRDKCIFVQTQNDDRGMVWVSVRDTGQGITDEIVGHLFDSLATTKGNGMGMGLSICKSIVEAHGGKIELCGGDSVGASFRFSVPHGSTLKTDATTISIL